MEPDRSLHAVPMWLAPSDGAILFATGSRSRKVRNLERDPRATLVLHDSRPGAEVCGASIKGRVELVRGAAAKPLVERVQRRFVSEPGLALPVVREFLSSDDVALRLGSRGSCDVGRARERRRTSFARDGHRASARADDGALTSFISPIPPLSESFGFLGLPVGSVK